MYPKVDATSASKANPQDNVVGTFEAFRRVVRYTLYRNTTILGTESCSAGYKGRGMKACV